MGRNGRGKNALEGKKSMSKVGKVSGKMVKSNGGIDNESKQTTSRSEIKRPSQYEDGIDNKRSKTEKQSKGRHQNENVTTEVHEDGLVINMAVTEEENREFEVGEGRNGEAMDESRLLNVASDDSEEDDPTEDRNNNAVVLDQGRHEGTARNCVLGESSMEGGTGTQKPMDKEELKFMERFAFFMEERGFLQKRGEPEVVKKSIPAPINTNKPPARKWLNMEVIGETTQVVHDDQSEATIYRPVVALSEGNGEMIQIMGSSDEFNNTSDDSANSDQLAKQIAKIVVPGEPHQAAIGRPVPHCSSQSEGDRCPQEKLEKPPTPQERVEQLIREAECAKERLLKIPGKETGKVGEGGHIPEVHNGNLLHSVIVDEEYTAIASHVDEGLRRKIILGDYVDLVRLIPRDHIQVEEEQCMEMVNRRACPTGSLLMTEVHLQLTT